MRRVEPVRNGQPSMTTSGQLTIWNWQCRAGRPGRPSSFGGFDTPDSCLHLATVAGGLSRAFTFIGDALGVLHDALRFKAREPILNGIMGERALQIAPFAADLRAAHVWSERNSLCDALSRLRIGQHPTQARLQQDQRGPRVPIPRRLLESI